MRKVLTIVAAFLIGTLFPFSPAVPVHAALSDDLPEDCNGAPAVAIVNGHGATQVAFYQDTIFDTVYVSWTLDSNGALAQTAPYKHATAIAVYSDWDGGGGYGNLYTVFKGPQGGGQAGFCEEMGEHHDFYFDIFGGVVGRTLGGSCTVSFTVGGSVSVGISTSGAGGGGSMNWETTISCEASVQLESAILVDLTEGYYHCPLVGTCILEIDVE